MGETLEYLRCLVEPTNIAYYLNGYIIIGKSRKRIDESPRLLWLHSYIPQVFLQKNFLPSKRLERISSRLHAIRP